ncbi:MAG: hypothetical protein WD080_08465 [Egibacteraceae bacterium]
MSNPARARVARGYARAGWVAATILVLAASVAVLWAGVLRPREEGAAQDGATDPKALQAREAFVAALGAGDTDRFGPLWCADPPPGGDAGEIAAQVEAEQDAHGPITDASVQGWAPQPPSGPSAVDIRVEHGTVQRDWTAILVHEPGRGWRVCGAGPHER